MKIIVLHYNLQGEQHSCVLVDLGTHCNINEFDKYSTGEEPPHYPVPAIYHVEMEVNFLGVFLSVIDSRCADVRYQIAMHNYVNWGTLSSQVTWDLR